LGAYTNAWDDIGSDDADVEEDFDAGAVELAVFDDVA
jgi:hypothetical protein